MPREGCGASLTESTLHLPFKASFTAYRIADSDVGDQIDSSSWRLGRADISNLICFYSMTSPKRSLEYNRVN